MSENRTILISSLGLIVALPASLLVTFVVSLVTRPLSTEHVERCMAGVRRNRS